MNNEPYKVKLTKHIKTILFATLWIAAGVGVTVLLVAAIRIKREKVCKGYEIEILGSGEGKGFLDKKNVEVLLTNKGSEVLTGKTTRTFELQKLEARIERHKWIKDAELFFDNNQVLQVKITERTPIARLITVNGNSYYIDSSCQRLPLSVKVSAKVPVFTGFPSDKSNLKPADKALLKEIRNVSEYILKHSFWMAQISQVDITEKRTFEMVPTIGNHIIEFGKGNNCDEKFKQLFTFYREVLSKTGMERYARINVQYQKQIIAVRNTYLSKADSIKHVKSIDYLIASSNIDSVRRDSSTALKIQTEKTGIQ
jgi:cell division protein FtsQ